MSVYRVEIRYRTKRGGVQISCFVEATDESAAMDFAEEKFVTPYPARKWLGADAWKVRRSEATTGIINAD